MKRNTFLLILMMIMPLGMVAQQPRAQHIRYVSKDGKYDNDGTEWSKAKNNVQDAINDLVDKGLQGEVWVAQGTYSPTESTEKSGGSTLYMSFKVPAGIVVRGGFHGPGTVPSGETLTVGKVLNADGTVNTAGTSYTTGTYPGESTLEDRVQVTAQQTIHGETINRDWTYKYPTILTGDLSTPAKFEWNTTKKWWDASFYGNCYHVVWFAMNGFDENGRAKPLDTNKGDAHVEGFTIMNGNARNTEINGRFHNAYGGGVYMVEGSRIENCRITNCEASRDGGGVYMDGGGVVKHCYIFNNQALGVGVQNGYGGGICLDANKSENLFGIYRSVVFGNVGRLGGGLAVKVLEHNPGRATDIRYTPFASAVLVGNNTATTEGGGVYTDGGGCMTNLTIVRNQCNGSGVINNGVATGRSGGLYCHNHAVVMNSVMWGNECAANNHMQYAASQSSNDEDLKVDMMYCTLSYSDNTDWTGTAKSHVFSLSEYNNADAMPSGRVPNDNEQFANFLNPSSQAGYCDELHLDDQQVIFWRPGANSALANNGIISLNLNLDGKYPFTSIPSDVLSNVYNPRSTLGAYTRQFGRMTPRITTENGETVYHFYVDPNAPTYRTSISHGISWDEPARFLANVLYTIDTTPEYINAKCVVHVKEGEVDNTCSYVGGKNVRDMTIGLRSKHVTLLGGYPAALTGTEEEQTNGGITLRRDPMSYPTFIVGEITDDYKMNVAHLVSFDGCDDVTFDGFQLRYANASDTKFNVSGHDGGAIRFIHGATNIRVRNVLIAGCTADRGAAIFAETGTTASFENVIIHNNEAANREGAIIYSEGSARLSFTHCNIMNNVGYPVYLNGSTTQQSFDNCIFFANLSENADNAYGNDATSVATIESKALPSFRGNAAGVTVTNCLFDNLTPALTGAVVVRGTNHGRLTYELNATGYPRFINATHNAGVSPAGDATFYGRATSFMPHNNNPMVNTAKHADMSTPSSWGTDITAYFTRTYGGLPDIGAVENHAPTEEEKEEDENAYAGGQQAMGNIVYVRTPEDGGSDNNSGNSWDDALATVQKAIEVANVEGGIEYGEAESITHSFNAGATLTSLQDMLNAPNLRIRSVSRNTCYWTNTNNTIVGSNQTGNNTYFKFEPVEGTTDEFYIRASNGRYITGEIRQNTSMTLGSNGEKQRFQIAPRETGVSFYINNVSSSATTYYCANAYNNTTIQGWSPSDNNSAWIITTTADFSYDETIQKPIRDTNNKQVWVAEGVYTALSSETTHALYGQVLDEGNVAGRKWNQRFSIMLREGVNVYGGFDNEGYPGMKDRDPKLYPTTVQPGDPVGEMTPAEKNAWASRGVTGEYPLEYRAMSDECGSFGRVVVQEKDFELETTFDGFTIKNGYLNACAKVYIGGQLHQVLSQSEDKLGLTGGAGVYLLRGGVLENCIITGNMTYTNVADLNNNAATAEANHQTFNTVFQSDGGYHTSGAGVFNNGGTIKNCQISYNSVLQDLARNSNTNYLPQAAWLYGAGLFMQDGVVYNTIIHDNICKFTDYKAEDSNYGGYDDPYSPTGITKNEFWQTPSSNSLTSGNLRESAAGCGVFLVTGDFYNNTVTHNTYRFWPASYNGGGSTIVGVGGIYAFTGSTIYNCIIANNEPTSLKAAGLALPSSVQNNQQERIIPFTSGDVFFNFPVMCFSSGGYNYNDAGVTARYSAIDYQSAATVWNEFNTAGATAAKPLRNLCVFNDLKDLTSNSVYSFNATNSYGYAEAGQECNPNDNSSGTDYSTASGTNWYGKRNDGDVLLAADYHLMAASPAINKGTNIIPNAVLPDYDAEYTERIKDCTVDMGAYEFDDSYAITPDVTKIGTGGETDLTKPAIYYVTPYGAGLASADSPANAACAEKLQRVLDAAGRYKAQHPTQQVIVKVANSQELVDADTHFTYYATRTTETDNSDVRVWSIIVPRGVEVWGGYNDSYASATDNGFYSEDGSGVRTDKRSITGNPTYFDSYYTNPEHENKISTYHVVTFTDLVFDGTGNPYKVGDDLTQNSTYNGSTGELMTMKSHNVTDRAVIDGIYITSGNANLKSSASGSQTLNIHSYGGAAIVTDYAHVRNCIVQGNQGVYGGALALTHKALVSGCLIEKNTADYGGAIYVFEEGATLSDGTKIDSRNEYYQEVSTDFDHRYDLNMPHVFSTTIVNNKANVQGGGVWFGTSVPNVRFNSSVVWQNDCQDQANVSGLFQITRPDGSTYTTTEYYPFNYCGVQNIQASGLNNVMLNTDNNLGVRFQKAGGDANDLAVKNEEAEGFAKFDDFGNYNLTNYSVMVHGGMPLENYQSLQERYKLSETDFLNKNRLVTLSDAEGGGTRHFIEMGALAFAKKFPTEQLMLRLFVSLPDHIDHQAANYMMELAATATDGSVEQYYSQEGSSFAYPMTHLQDALDYIMRLRGFNKGNPILTEVVDNNRANDLPFEIFVSDGTFYPSTDLSGNNNNTVGNSFLIPEGVSIIGGNAPNFATDEEGKEYSNAKRFYGAGFTPHILPKGTDVYYTAYNQLPLANKEVTLGDYTIHQRLTDSITVHRKLTDINANSIIEPWEFTHQTILSGFLEGVQNNGVNHVLTVLANEYACGALPTTVGGEHNHNDEETSGISHEYFCAEHGQNIALDGLTVIGGYAHGYLKNTVNDRHKLKFDEGGGLLVDGNYYYDHYNKVHKGGSTDEKFQKATYFHATAPGAVGYRDIPVLISNCKFENNHAGYGGAVSTNTTLDIFNSSFEHNRALSGSDEVDWTHYDNDGNQVFIDHKIKYPGNGGAIYSTHQVSAFNTLFANNEALDTAFNYEPQVFYLLHTLAQSNRPTTTTTTTPREMIGGSGGAVFVARHGYYHFTNCNFVRNQANVYPVVFSYNPNYQAQENNAQLWMQYNQIVNCVLWGNEMNPKMVDALNNSPLNQQEKENYIRSASKVVNYGRKDRDPATYNPAITTAASAETQEELDSEAQEQIWFSAYEKGKAITAKNAYDFRNMEYSAYTHIIPLIKNYAANVYKQPDGTVGLAGGYYQNCNVEIASENAVNEGPNFVNPSSHAGYDGYVESADWSPARLNNLSDNGWGKIMQRINPIGNEYKAEFVTTSDGKYDVTGFYPEHRYLESFIKFQKTIPIGEARYMFADYPGALVPLRRISYDPNPSHDQTYIDIGVYEYPHTELKYTTEGDEVDVLWVSSKEKPDNGLPDGSAWSQPTSDLQRAIETLLSSRNGHRKEIRLMDGTFTPVYTIDDHLCFYFDTEYLNKSVLLETTDVEGGTTPIYNEGVRSLTIKGGYSHELNNVRDVEQYPAIIRQQKRTDASSTRWDHLIYIADPTQRYGKEHYDEQGGPEHDFGHYLTQNQKVINTIPMEIDGVTLINDQATQNATGTAIYYADLDDMTADGKDADGIIQPTPANVTTSITTGENDVENHTYATLDKPAKLVLSKTKVMGSGAYDKSKTASAVYLGNNGGYNLIYNTVMHSNYGDPLVTNSETRTINNTFALNGGMVDMSSDRATNSFIHNTVLWKNNFLGATGYGNQFNLHGFGTSTDTQDATFARWDATHSDAEMSDVLLFSHNAYTGGDTVNTDYQTGAAIALRHYNVGLTFDNSDFMLSPHFTDPENPTIESRNFSLQPSLRLLHKGNDALYDDQLTVEADKLTSQMYDLAMHTSLTEDAASNARKVNTIDIGAYEYQNVLNRILYVDPNKTGENTGLGWEHAFAIGHLQNAIDLAALYHLNKPDEQAYVFIKGATQGNKDLHTEETLTVRDGVSVYGGIHSMFTTECEIASVDNVTGERTYTDAALGNFVQAVTSHNEGFIGPNTNRTAIYGIQTNKYTLFDTTPENGITTLIKGFHVTGNTDATAPLIDIDPQVATGATGLPKVALTNIVTYENTTATDVPVARVKNALIYESLFRNNNTNPDNTPTDNNASVLELGGDAWAVSITAEGKVTGVDGSTWLNGGKDRTEELASHIVNSIANFRGEDTRTEIDPDATRNTLTGHNYVRNDRNCYYQLTERSKHINEIKIASGTQGNEFLPANLRSFVNYRTDRDLLGNPRLLTLITGDGTDQLLDRGAFETWKIDRYLVETKEEGHFNPHTGSVVYIMEGCNLKCGIELYPGYLLLKEGASLWGNGQNVKLSFVAVERTIQPGGSVVSIPYNLDYATQAEKPVYEENGVLNLAQTTHSTFDYDAAQRSAWNHEFHKVDSENWVAQAENAITPKNQGVLFVPEETEATVYRFTGKGYQFDDFVYEEKEEERFKQVVLTQHDDRTSTEGSADFTSKEDMGWNCIGLPYLVSNYETQKTTYSGEEGIYNLNLPHTLWLYYDGTMGRDGELVDGDGGFYSVPSWSDVTAEWHLGTNLDRPRLWMGEGIFTQTAAVDAEETLTFYRPVLSIPEEIEVKGERRNTRFYVGDEEEMMDELTHLLITTSGRTIRISGLMGGERITVYDVSGRRMAGGTASAFEWRATLPGAGVYIVKVDDERTKVSLR